MDPAQFNAVIAAYHIERRRALYLHTANPIHAWSAYRIARVLKVAVPPWVLDVFDTWAEVLTEGTHDSKSAIADALKIGKRGGPLVTEQAKSELRDLQMVARIEHLRRQRPTRAEQEAALKEYRKKYGLKGEVVDPGDRNLTEIMEQVAGEYGIDYVSVRAKYYKLIRPLKHK